MEAKEIVFWSPEAMGGELVFSGTRVPVETFADYLKAGYSVEAFLSEFPEVDREQVEGYIDLAAEITAEATAEATAKAAAKGTVGDDQYTHRLLEDLTETELTNLRGRQDFKPSKKGSGLSDVSRDHDRYLAEG